MVFITCAHITLSQSVKTLQGRVQTRKAHVLHTSNLVTFHTLEHWASDFTSTKDNTSMSEALLGPDSHLPFLHPSSLPSFSSPFHPSFLPISDVIHEAPRPDTHSRRAGWSPGLLCISEGRRGVLGAGSSTGWAWESASGNSRIFFFQFCTGKNLKRTLPNILSPEALGAECNPCASDSFHSPQRLFRRKFLC